LLPRLLLDTHIIVRWLAEPLAAEGSLRLKIKLEDFFAALQANPIFRILPLTYEVASEVASLAGLRDRADRAIVATARLHRLSLVTSDQRIIASKFVTVIE
jgi:PIN domain nuclease of toxin-antitoxin system